MSHLIIKAIKDSYDAELLQKNRLENIKDIVNNLLTT